ncbi:hypothetical protein WJX73_007352 [Symbiochloris irregularis]|uniref:Uncharacterized protein n=1 Tax=Symbiochloris irregularis TaxID=706552 RepID=A0AAW1PCG2_9CHLO
MFDPAARHAQLSQQGNAAQQAELLLRDRRVLSLSLTEWREYLLLFSEEVVFHVDKLQQHLAPGPLQPLPSPGAPSLLEQLSRASLAEAATIIAPYLPSETATDRFNTKFYEDHNPPFANIFDGIAERKGSKQTSLEVEEGAALQVTLGKTWPLMFLLATGSRAGKSHFVFECNVKQMMYNDRHHERYKDYGEGLFVMVDFNGSGDPLERAQEEVPTLVLGQRIFARSLLKCSLRALRHALVRMHATAFLNYLDMDAVLDAVCAVRWPMGDAALSAPTTSKTRHIVVVIDELQVLHQRTMDTALYYMANDCLTTLNTWCQASPSTEERCVLLAGTGLAFCDVIVTDKWTCVDLSLPPLTPESSETLLAEQIANVAGGLDMARLLVQNDRGLRTMFLSTLFFPGILMMLGEAVRILSSRGLKVESKPELCRAEFLKLVGSVTAVKAKPLVLRILGSPRTMTCIALMTLSGLLFKPNTTWVGNDLTLGQFQDALGTFYVYNEQTERQEPAWSLLMIPSWLLEYNGSGVQEAAADQALGWSSAILAEDPGVILLGGSFERDTAARLLAKHYLLSEGLFKEPLNRVHKLARLFPGALAPAQLLETRMRVDPLIAVRDTKLFLSGPSKAAARIDTMDGRPIVTQIDRGNDLWASERQLNAWDDTGLLFLCDRRTGSKAMLIDLRYFADIQWTPGQPERTLVAVQCKGQDSAESLSWDDVQEDFAALQAAVDWHNAGDAKRRLSVMDSRWRKGVVPATSAKACQVAVAMFQAPAAVRPKLMQSSLRGPLTLARQRFGKLARMPSVYLR